jgi:glucose-6-phosphate dehydrogenase assembly protein OpcA
MISQKIVAPSKIEQELFQIWDSLAKKNKTRASLFNLIVYAKQNERYDNIRKIVQSIVEKFPCRVLFITHDDQTKKNFLKTAISVLFQKEKDSDTACDSIDIGVSGSDIEKVPYLLSPHFLPDLPIYLFWPENPIENKGLFEKLKKFASRIIFDSESFESVYQFARYTLQMTKVHPFVDFADIQWIYMENWKNCIAATFYSEERLEKLKGSKIIEIHYTAAHNLSFAQNAIQALYFQGWLSSRLDWHFSKGDKKSKTLTISYNEDTAFKLIPKYNKEPKDFSKVVIITKNKEEFHFVKKEAKQEEVLIKVNTQDQCELPYTYYMGNIEMGSSLSNELTYKGTSTHFLQTLDKLDKQ